MASPRQIRRIALAVAFIATASAAHVGAAGAAERSRHGGTGRVTHPAAGPATGLGFFDLRPTMQVSPDAPLTVSRRDDGVFGSVPIHVAQIGLTPRWNAIQATEPAAQFAACLGEAARCTTELQRRLRAIAVAGSSPPAGQGTAARESVRAVNRLVNAAIRYQSDSVVWNSEDYWASPQETVARGLGDCEDYALLKLAMLVALGFPETDMSVVVVKDTSRGIGHAILAVRTRDGYEVLDNLSDAVRRDSEVESYVPLYSIGAAGAWVHGRRREVPMMQAATQRSTPVAGARLRGSLN